METLQQMFIMKTRKNIEGILHLALYMIVKFSKLHVNKEPLSTI